MEVHILNGDALKEQFPNTISGEPIICRECLVQGSVAGDLLTDLYKNRSKFLDEAYGDCSLQEYQDKVASEFQKVIDLSQETVVNLWFEDDLFCQVNLWFISYLLDNHTSVQKIFLVRPTAGLQFGFGGMNSEELEKAYRSRILLTSDHIKSLSLLWKYYQTGQYQSILELSSSLNNILPLIQEAAQANLERFPTGDSLGRPEKAIIAIMDRLSTKEFVPIFREFNKQESIYGFGDLQVKTIYDEVINLED